MKSQIRSFLSTQSGNGSIDHIDDSASLLDAGVLDSLMMVDLVTHLESTFKIVVDDDDMVPENFDSIDSITGYLERKCPSVRTDREITG